MLCKKLWQKHLEQTETAPTVEPLTKTKRKSMQRKRLVEYAEELWTSHKNIRIHYQLALIILYPSQKADIPVTLATYNWPTGPATGRNLTNYLKQLTTTSRSMPWATVCCRSHWIGKHTEVYRGYPPSPCARLEFTPSL